MFAHPGQQLVGRLKAPGAAFVGADHLDQWDLVRRVRKVGADDALAVLRFVGNLGDADHRGVAAQDGLRWAEAVLIGKELLLERQGRIPFKAGQNPSYPTAGNDPPPFSDAS